MKQSAFRIVVASALTVASCASGFSQQRTRTSPALNEDAIRARIKFLSSDLLEGRGTGARGGEIAANYIAAQMEALGLKGAGANGSFFQPVSLVGVKADPSTKLNISGRNGKESFKFADEYVAFTGAQTEEVDLDAELVFVGYGINAPEQRWNDYKGGPEDYRGKILVMLVNDPPATTAEPNLFGARALTYYGRWTYKYEEAARRGAAGVILLHTDQSAGYPWGVVRTSNGSWRFDIARAAGDETPFLKMRSWVTDDAARKIMKLAGQDLDDLRAKAASRDFQPVALNLKGKINLKSEVKRVQAPNVVGILPGSDPKLRDEYVVYSAHWDHLGVGAPDKDGDTIYNGALDNATGVASVLAIAEALAKLPPSQRPRRSSLFLFPTAEEQGLIGAEWYAKHPLVPLEKTAANVNLDSMNVLGRTLDFIPLGADRSSLKAVVAAVAREHGMRVSADARPEQGSFYRSDHFPFARVGVPSISLKEGNEYEGHTKEWGEEQFKAYNTAHYHQPSDEYDDAWDFRGMLQETEIAMAIGIRIANAAVMPRFNPDDEFAKAQKR
ncbi:MAG TPA: M28 family peptidase [Pyrinomonadaceae bacterium]|jgi:Zn-dependent M28 family amino/carboxypeptidase|nr:M28 family peptidase [Pyrinomonadaceae bacterium]